jgi:peroxiredoxin Q/BCP
VKVVVSALLSATVAVSAAGAQAATASASTGPGVGATAPTFSLPGATRYGVLRDPVNLADYRGKVVVLAFFFKARTKG